MSDDFDIVQFFIDLFIWMIVCGLVGALIGRCRGRIIDGLGWGIVVKNPIVRIDRIYSTRVPNG